jgi:hypothetical protein
MAELFKLERQGDVWNGKISAQATLFGNDAEAIARLWQAQSFVDDSLACHNPGYAIKFTITAKSSSMRLSAGTAVTSSSLCRRLKNGLGSMASRPKEANS